MYQRSRLPPPEALEAGADVALERHDDVFEHEELHQHDEALEHDAQRYGPVHLGDVLERGWEHPVRHLEQGEEELEERVIRDGHAGLAVRNDLI